MKPENNHRSLVTNGSQASASFEISLKDSAHIMGILREGLYTDRILAVLREYSANAWDAHRSVGKHTLPIEVQIPTSNEPLLRIRDYGTGLSHDDMFAVFTQYGSSTKRDSDDVVGMLGIGSKSGFAYADTFTVISRHGGHKRTYVAALDESEKGTLSLLADDTCAKGDTGLEIQITTKGDDWYEWQRRAERLYRHFDPRPKINITLPERVEGTKLEHGTIRHGDDEGKWIAIMGCVPYRVNVDQLDESKLPKCIRLLSGEIAFPIGGVAVSASREELKYTTATKAVLIDKFTALVDEYVTQALKMLESSALSAWESRLRVRVLQRMELPLPESWKAEYGQAFVQVKYDDTSGFVLLHNAAVTTRITIDSDTTLWIDDVNKDLKGYDLTIDDYVVRSKTLDAKELRTVLDAVLAASKLTGIKIQLLSTRSWAEWRLPKKKVVNPKHRAKMFQHVGDGKHSKGNAYSDHWEPVTRVPEDTDVFVLLEAFKPDGCESWYYDYVRAKKFASFLGETMPEVYGYKTTEKRPVLVSACSGQTWDAWYKSLRERTTAKIVADGNAEQYHWSELNSGGDYYEAHRHLRSFEKRNYDRVVAAFGLDHNITQTLTKVRTAQAASLRNVIDIIDDLRRTGVEVFGEWEKSEAKREIAAIIKKYPLLKEGIMHLWANEDTKAKHWHEYVLLMDAKAQLQAMAAAMPTSPAQLKAVP